jgi:hypothetical protein
LGWLCALLVNNPAHDADAPVMQRIAAARRVVKRPARCRVHREGRRPHGPSRLRDSAGCEALRWRQICPLVIRRQSQNQRLNDCLRVQLVQAGQRESAFPQSIPSDKRKVFGSVPFPGDRCLRSAAAVGAALAIGCVPRNPPWVDLQLGDDGPSGTDVRPRHDADRHAAFDPLARHLYDNTINEANVDPQSSCVCLIMTDSSRAPCAIRPMTRSVIATRIQAW